MSLAFAPTAVQFGHQGGVSLPGHLRFARAACIHKVYSLSGVGEENGHTKRLTCSPIISESKLRFKAVVRTNADTGAETADGVTVKLA